MIPAMRATKLELKRFPHRNCNTYEQGTEKNYFFLSIVQKGAHVAKSKLQLLKARTFSKNFQLKNQLQKSDLDL